MSTDGRRSRLDALRSRVGRGLHERFRIDRRALAAFRIALGCLLVADLVLRSRSLRAFYTDEGVYPVADFHAYGDPLHLSLHAISGEAWVQVLLFCVAGLLGIALAVGYRTRIATVGSWLMLVSLHNRMPAVLNGGDVLLRLLLFWAIFLPLGARWAVDSYQRTDDPDRTPVASVASAALLCQVVLVYLVNAAMKLSGEIWLRGEGLEYVFSLGQFTVFLGDHLEAVPPLLVAGDYLWLAMVATAFLLVVLRGRRRTAYVGLFVAMHVGMGLTMQLGLFPLISVAALLPFLPAWFWDRAVPPLADRRPVAGARRALRGLAAWLPTIRITDVPSALSRWTARARTAVVVCVLVLVVLWNVQFLGYGEVAGQDVTPEAADSAIDLTRTDQYWTMFAPEPLSVDGWLVAPGTFPNGTRIDAFHGGRVTWDRPDDVSSTYPTHRWRKYLTGLWRSGSVDRQLFADYLCGRYDDAWPHLTNVSVYYVEQPTRLDGPEPTERVRLATQDC